MEEFGVLSGMAANGTGDLGTCQDDFCDAGVDGYEKYVSGIFGWVHDKAVSLGIAVVSFVDSQDVAAKCLLGVPWLMRTLH